MWSHQGTLSGCPLNPGEETWVYEVKAIIYRANLIIFHSESYFGNVGKRKETPQNVIS